MNLFRVPLIAVLTMTSLAAFAQQSGIRVIGPDSEHVYSTDGRLLDDQALQLQNERAQQAKVWREQREIARRQQELDAEQARAERDQAAAMPYDDQQSDQGWWPYYDGSFVGSGRFRRAFGSGRPIRRPGGLSHHR
jgi:hypothetical protein